MVFLRDLVSFGSPRSLRLFGGVVPDYLASIGG
jgi:hypothetical protein